MTEEQRPARERAYQPWTDQEYGVLEKRYYEQDWSLERVALSLSRYPSEVENALIKLKGLNEAMTNRTQAQAHVEAVGRCKESHETIRKYPEHLIDRYGNGLRPLDAVHKPKTTILDLAEIEKRIPDIYEEAWKHIIRKARRLIINGKNYDTLLRKARERVHLQIEISATLAGGK